MLLRMSAITWLFVFEGALNLGRWFGSVFGGD